MSHLGKILWFIPLAVHLGFAAAVYDNFPDRIGRTPDSDGIALPCFYALFFLCVVVANGLFLWMYLRMPKFKDRMFAVPGRSFWLRDETNRRLMIVRLRGIIEVSLLGLNVFFLAVFQAIYQANVVYRIIALSRPVLFVGFMLLPLLMVVVYFALAVLGLRKDAEQQE